MYNFAMIDDKAASESMTWAEHLYNHVTQHVQTEQGLLESYIEAAGNTESRALSYLVNLIVEDERRHHRLFNEFAASLKHGLQWTDGGQQVPELDFYKCDRRTMHGIVHRLRENEDQDLRDLHDLQKMVKDAKDSTLWDLIVELMQRDTEKHIAILRFVEKHIDG